VEGTGRCDVGRVRLALEEPRVAERLLTFGCVSVVAVALVRAVLTRPSTVSVRGRLPRRGLGRQTFV